MPGPLAHQQAALIAALVAGAGPPAGFDPGRVRATRAALLRKRAAEVGASWPLLAASIGTQWSVEFGRWADGRPPAGSLRDGWDFARTRGALDRPAAEELAVREAGWRYEGLGPPRPRRAPAVRWARGTLVVQVLGRVWLRSLRRRP